MTVSSIVSMLTRGLVVRLGSPASEGTRGCFPAWFDESNEHVLLEEPGAFQSQLRDVVHPCVLGLLWGVSSQMELPRSVLDESVLNGLELSRREAELSALENHHSGCQDLSPPQASLQRHSSTSLNCISSCSEQEPRGNRC